MPPPLPGTMHRDAKSAKAVLILRILRRGYSHDLGTFCALPQTLKPYASTPKAFHPQRARSANYAACSRLAVMVISAFRTRETGQFDFALWAAD
jgi:hypothetical protein